MSAGGLGAGVPSFAEGEPASEAKRKVVSGVQGQSPWENFKVLELSKRRKHYRKRAQRNRKPYHFPKQALVSHLTIAGSNI